MSTHAWNLRKFAKPYKTRKFDAQSAHVARLRRYCANHKVAQYRRKIGALWAVGYPPLDILESAPGEASGLGTKENYIYFIPLITLHRPCVAAESDKTSTEAPFVCLASCSQIKSVMSDYFTGRRCPHYPCYCLKIFFLGATNGAFFGLAVGKSTLKERMRRTHSSSNFHKNGV